MFSREKGVKTKTFSSPGPSIKRPLFLRDFQLPTFDTIVGTDNHDVCLADRLHYSYNRHNIETIKSALGLIKFLLGNRIEGKLFMNDEMTCM